MILRLARILCVLSACAAMTGVGGNAYAQASGGDIAPAPFDFYVLSLSWAPSFCAQSRSNRSEECAPGSGFGFVVHGLWPQNDHGYPSDCDAAPLPRMALEQARGLYPDLGLARHEWRAHGGCTGLSPTAYFAAVRRARAMVQTPPQFAAPTAEQSVAPLDVQRAFMSANPRLLSGMIAVTCRRGAIEEARICLTKDLRGFRSCPEVARAACRSSTVSVPPVD